jgi:KUP system potassium uptake protein
MALGIVYGDIGTSPLYAVRESFGEQHGIAPITENLLGVISLVFWALLIIVSIKYLVFAVRADNRGEGGILVLSARVTPYLRSSHRLRMVALFLGLAGAALLYGDSMITPAISVLSAVEGLEVATPAFGRLVIPLTVAILVGLFLLQERGTAGVGAFFGPVMVLWFASLAALGVRHIVQAPEILAAVNPVHAVEFLPRLGTRGFLVLGSVFLVVTGAEAMYADLGHFGRAPMRLAWFAVALPALLLNYFGQGALLLRNPEAVVNPFYLMAPRWALYPLVGLATAATVIASQAVITGAFSLTRQAIQMGYLPRMRIEHTSHEQIGQIYMPAVNWVLMLACIGLVLGFQSTASLAAAYGVAVSTTMIFTTLLLVLFARFVWRWGVVRAGLFALAMLGIESVFWAAILLKIPYGGWFPLVVAGAILVLMTTWRRGTAILAIRTGERTLALRDLPGVLGGSSITRVPGTAVFMNRYPDRVPAAFLHNLKHNKVRHERIAFVTVRAGEVPHVPPEERVRMRELGDGFHQITISYGFIDDPNVPRELAPILIDGRPLEAMETTYFVGRDKLLAMGKSHMARWRVRLFCWMSRNAERATTFLEIPPNRVVEVGAQLEL